MAAPAPSRTRQAAVVYNPIKVDLDRLRDAVAAAESREGWRKSRWLETTPEQPGGEQARRAIADGVDVVLAAGGDGTVRAVAEALRGSDVAIALLPAGTGNLLARNLDMILTHLADSVDLAFGGTDRRIDMGVIELDRPDGSAEEHAFLVMAGFGLDAKMIANARPELKKRVGWLAYVDAIARALRDTDRVRMRVRVDGGEERTASVHTLIAGNCGALPGNVLLLPDAEIDDGLFDVVTLRPEGLLGWVQIWGKITWENGVLRRGGSVGRKLAGMAREVRALRYYRARELDVRLERPEEFELDGDPFGEVIGFRLRVDPGSLIVRVPA
ncbi:diacylglycerol kinase family protein [Pseudolysinimonas kribbensis]|uniref:diacylglycerol/lipid kinase family protein n=1 Tax=Pseudolysinimonas kribbensis TaxID=433641 RepID=UPI0031D5623D